ncbi:hypothetical protein [Kribbella sp. NPDC048928]|uniref:hypothetical protein n=1 Tax=Kribbella sp. NPDC048928 TaxID=3364111 RepID=UPI0037164C0A
MERVWYVAYGSNLALGRFRCYLAGGRPAGGARVYPGCRDRSDAARMEGVELAGGLVFAGASRVWGGGSAFFDRAALSRVAGRAYLLTPDQLGDVAAQEMRRDPGGSYAREVAELDPVAPTAPYLRWIAAGLVEAHGWSLDQVVEYLQGAPGVQLGWTPGALLSVLDGDAGGGG